MHFSRTERERGSTIAITTEASQSQETFSTLTMALVAASAPCLVCATLGPVAERNLRSIEVGTVSLAASTTRRQYEEACLASSSSCQMFGSSQLAWRASLTPDRHIRKRGAAGIRCEQSSEGGASNSLDIWIGRAAMLGFVAALGVEIATGKGVLETAGITAPAPTVAWGLTAIVGFITAFGVFRSASKE